MNVMCYIYAKKKWEMHVTDLISLIIGLHSPLNCCIPNAKCL